MNEENRTKPGDASAIDADNDEQVVQHAQETKLLHGRIAELLAEVDVLREVTRNKQALEHHVIQLREANQHLVLAAFGAQDLQATAEAANRQQEEFLSMLAHELRNPLAPISLANELLGKIQSAHPQLPRLHDVIHRQVSHLVHLVDDLLDASRIRSGKITLQKRPLLLSEVIQSAVETSQPFVNKRHQQLIVRLPVDAVIDGDLVRLAQVFSNLLINATKFTPEYEDITILASKAGNAVTVSVKDNGIGIAADILPSIFELFTQGFQSLDRSQGGLGIGLALVRSIVEMHGGTVSADSPGVGLGSEFTVVLPISAELVPKNLARSSQASALRHCRVLLIEDNVDSNEALKNLLMLDGHTVASAFDGTTGLTMAKENTYDVIICDIGLPGMNGYEVAKELHQDTSKPVPCLIAMTGYNQLKNRTQAEKAGFDHYLVKPVDVNVLTNLISINAPQ